VSDVESFSMVPLSNLLEGERKAWADQIGVMVPVDRFGRRGGDLEPVHDGEWVRYSDYAKLKAEVERLKGGQS
jgi:hypothetical protein